MEGLLPRSVVDSIRRTAKGLNGFPRRVFQAVVTKEYVEGKPRKAETLFGWNRYAVTLYVRFEKSFQSRRFLKPMQSLATLRQLTNGPRTVERPDSSPPLHSMNFRQ